jgi:hypothetical protein
MYEEASCMMKKVISLILIAAMAFTIVPAVTAQSQTTFTDVPSTHWAASAIAEAVQAGYVSGYPDGTFKPDQVVTREEFIKMAVEAFGLDTSRYTAPDMWSLPYLAAAVENGWIASDEYDKRKDKLIPPEGYKDRGARIASFQKKDGNLMTIFADTAHYPMPRHEMAKVAINALGKSVENTGKDWEYKNAVMRQAVNLGLIHGMGNGNLAPDGTTTRAQAVVVIQRMLTLKNGGTLPVSDDAKDSASKERDPWGRVIRTTNLPKNASDFPYILEGIPNEMYEMPLYRPTDQEQYNKTPKDVFDGGYFTKEGLDISLARVEKALNLILNVDYKTIDPEAWGKELAENQRGGPLIQDYINAQYAKWVIENKIQIEGTAEVEPSMIYENRLGTFVRAKVKFRINNYDKMTNELLYDPYLKLVYENNEKYRLKKGIWYEGYADIEFSTVTLGEEVSNTYGLSVEASLFRWSTFNGVNYGFK